MRKSTVFFSLVFLSIFIAGCDNGSVIGSDEVPSKLKVLVERMDAIDENEKLVIYAMDFQKEGHDLTFVCPCYIAGSPDQFLNVQVAGESFKLTLLPNAEYNIEVTYWAPNADNNTKIQFRTSRIPPK